MATTHGIDVSKHNGTINWAMVKTSGKVNFAMLRAGYGRLVSQKDAQFEANYKGAKSVGVPFGAYWYSYALSEDEARAEADACLAVLKGKQFEYPIYYDIEEEKTLTMGKARVSAIARAFCEKLEKAGYEVQAIMRGLGEEPAIREIYISHAREALSRQDAECRPADGTSGNSSRFFANKDCQYYPCHEGQDPFNCMFCYCPFYLQEKCPGTPVWTKSKKTGRQIKDCTPCTFPHKPESYDVIINWIIKQNEKS